jgi:hypothetical protein
MSVRTIGVAGAVSIVFKTLNQGFDLFGGHWVFPFSTAMAISPHSGQVHGAKFWAAMASMLQTVPQTQ